MPKKKKIKIGTGEEKEKKEIQIGQRKFEVIGENRFSPRIFEAILARGAIIMDALDEARIQSFQEGEKKKKGPIYKHTILLGKDDEGNNLRASVSVFENSVVVQTLREV